MHSQLLNGRVYIMKFTVQKRLKPRGKAGLLNDEAQDAYWLLYNDAEVCIISTEVSANTA